jgi:hypothetical protein
MHVAIHRIDVGLIRIIMNLLLSLFLLHLIDLSLYLILLQILITYLMNCLTKISFFISFIIEI